ncbi:PAS domain S-box protein [Candidatus Uhrbacteria bacterium]|nr:PAS domain S-box protein [Candidatus Uhrbacteria bacterium]
MSMFKKILFSILLISIIQIVFVFLFSNWSFRKTLINIQERSFEQSANLKILIIKNFFDEWKLKTTSLIDEIRLNDQINTKAESFLKKNADVKKLFILDSDGNFIFSSNAKFPDLGKQTLQNAQDKIFISDLYKNQTDGSIDFLIGAPINNLGEPFIGTVMLEISAENLFKVVQSSGRIGGSEETLLAVLSPDKTYLTFINPLLFDKNAAFNKTVKINDPVGLPIQDAVQQKIGQGQRIDYRGVKVFAVWSYIPERKWGIVTKIDTKELLMPANTVGIVIFIFCLIFLLFIVFVSWLLGRLITNPIYSLTLGAKQIQRGNYKYRVKVKTSDEIEELANSFNQMARSLEKNNKELLEYSNKLESMVEVKTRELEKFKLAVDNVSDQIIITDPEGVVLYANRSLEKITGYKPSEAIEKKSGSLWGGLMPKDFYKKLWNTIKTKKKVFNGEIQNKRKNGEIYTAQIIITPIFDDKGKIIFFVGVERDVTLEKQIDKAKTEFVSLASHQLRTPLTSINWFIEMLMSGNAGKMTTKQLLYLKDVYSSSKRMSELINSLLNVSRIELGVFISEPIISDLRKIADTAIDELKQSIINKKQTLKTSFDPNLPMIKVDPKLTIMIFQNILSNATKYTPKNGAISFDVKKNGKNALIIISDNGIGIPKTQHSKIFTKMFRADNARKIDTDGSGLGLYLVKGILDQTGGTIRFESEEGKGTTFFVTIPLKGMKKKSGTKTLV